MPDLLLELLSEEIPARMQKRAAVNLEKSVNSALLDAGFMPEAVKAFAGPRRLTVVATGLPARQADRREEKKGPRVGAPDKAIEGFLRAAGLTSIDECEVREDKKGSFYVAVLDRKGRSTCELVADFVPEIVRTFAWPKSMRWGAASADEGALKWVRPLTSILCTFDGDIVPFHVDGIASADITRGHRFMANDDIQVRSFDAYREKLQNAKVVLDGAARREMILNDAQTLCTAQGLELVEDEGLLNEVAGLAEWPVAMIGSFDEKFLTLPDEVLIASMRGHQKYFSVRDPKTQRLANRFIFIANLDAPDGGSAMRTGYERVLTARLSDGWYLYAQDLKTPLGDRIADLDRVAFFEGLGTLGDKARRIAALASKIAANVGASPQEAERAALLSKADLVTGMVYEFPELQGVMGRYYAQEQGEPAPVADAIRDHYKPVGQDDAPPAAPVSIAVALADKIDTLAAFFSIGKRPTGSGDPFALRRAALGVIRTITGNDVRLSLAEILSSFAGPDGRHDFRSGENHPLDFIGERFKVFLRDQGSPHDAIEAVFSLPDANPADDLVGSLRRLQALEGFLATDDGTNLVAAYKRAANILKAEEKKGDLPSADEIDASAFVDAAEKSLFAALEEAEVQSEKALGEENFAAAMSALAALRGSLDAFFEGVTVNADDPALRANRLALLGRLLRATGAVADLSKLEG